MAFYTWLSGGVDAYDVSSWPSLGEWSVDRTPSKDETGWTTFLGSDVCSQTPWHRLPSQLWLLETEGQYRRGNDCVYWEKVLPTKCYGSLNLEMVADVTVLWLKAEYEMSVQREFTDFSRVRIDHIGKCITNLEAFNAGEDYDFEMLDKHSWTPLTHAVRACRLAKMGEQKKAWMFATSIPKDCRTSDIRLDMARRLALHLES